MTAPQFVMRDRPLNESMVQREANRRMMEKLQKVVEGYMRRGFSKRTIIICEFNDGIMEKFEDVRIVDWTKHTQ